MYEKAGDGRQYSDKAPKGEGIVIGIYRQIQMGGRISYEILKALGKALRSAADTMKLSVESMHLNAARS